MKLILNENAGPYRDVFLFLTQGEENSSDFRIVAETEFYNLGPDNFESLQFFIEEANDKLEY